MILIKTNLTRLDQHYIAHSFRRFGISYDRVKVKGVTRKCVKIDFDDVKKVIEIYNDRLKEKYDANYIITRKRWIGIYKELQKEIL
jgi:outer membrane protein assembly factor BamE (lipoprotein component of BamABCDE complex)